ncbi:MAG: DUF308 domain-containing protein, partial [Bacteroidales bacterium]|nr:DUF308 domain-containing protein [Bacteroidales bacterium]
VGIRNLWFIINHKPEYMKIGIIRNLILIAFGFIFLFVPFKSAVVIVNLLGIVAIIYGLITLYYSYKLFGKTKVE